MLKHQQNNKKGPYLYLCLFLGLLVCLMTGGIFLKHQSNKDKVDRSLNRLMERQKIAQKGLVLPIEQNLEQADTTSILRQVWQGEDKQIGKEFSQAEKAYLQALEDEEAPYPDLVNFFLVSKKSHLSNVHCYAFKAKTYHLKDWEYAADSPEEQTLLDFSFKADGQRLTLDDLIASPDAFVSLVREKLTSRDSSNREEVLSQVETNLSAQPFEATATSLILWPADRTKRLELPYKELYQAFHNDLLTGEAKLAYDKYLADKAEAERLAKEAAENAGTSQQQARVITKGEEGRGRVVALTFDDGPRQDTTPRVLDILNQHGIKGTFFVLGNAIAGNENLLKTMVNQGHQLGNHTWSHPNLTQLSTKQIQDEVDRTQQKLTEVTGTAPTLLRPPYGAYDEKVLQATDLPLVNWSIDTQDWQRPGTAAILANVKAQLSEGGIVLMHDIHPTTVDALPAVIDYLKSEGYRFVTVNQLLADQ